MTKIYGRKKQLEFLNQLYETEKFEFGYVYGQKRIGKSTLLNFYARGKEVLYFYAIDSAEIDILNSFANSLREVGNKECRTLNNWEDFFNYLKEYICNRKIVVCIEEYQNIVLGRDGKRKNTSFNVSLEKAINNLFFNKRLKLILTSSNVSFIEKEISDPNSILNKKSTFKLNIKKYDFKEALEVLKDIKDNNEKAKILSLTNTFPYYLSLIDINKSFDENLKKLFFDHDAFFIRNPDLLIECEKVTGGLYASLVNHIAKGENTPNELAKSLEADPRMVNKYLKELVNEKIVIKRKPFNNNKNVYYEIFDPMLAFYYRFIRERKDIIQNENINFQERLKYEINDFISHSFNNLCLTYLEYLNENKRLKGSFNNFHKCSLDNKKLGKKINLDIVSSDKDKLLIGLINVSKEEIHIRDYLNILKNLESEPFNLYKDISIYLFSVTGFDIRYQALDDSRLHLIDLKKMFEE